MIKGNVLAGLTAVLVASTGHGEAIDNAARDVRIELSSFAIKPQSVTLEHGHTYVLTFVNRSSHSHDFTAADFFGAVSLSQAERSKLSDGRVRLAGGEQVRVTLSPVKAGTFEFHCSHLFHSSLGMRGVIRVL